MYFFWPFAHTFPLAKTSMSALPARLGVLAYPRPGMHGHRFLDDETVLDELANVLPGVGIGDLVDLIGIQPDLVAATFQNT